MLGQRTSASSGRQDGCSRARAGRPAAAVRRTGKAGLLSPPHLGRVLKCHPAVQELAAAEAHLQEVTQTQQACAKAVAQAEAMLPRAQLDCRARQQALADVRQRLAGLQGTTEVRIFSVAGYRQPQSKL